MYICCVLGANTANNQERHPPRCALMASTHGTSMVKTVFDANTGQLLGARMVGAEVNELFQGFVVAMGLETPEEELMHNVFPHRTLSEMMHESVFDSYGRAIHI